MNFPSDRVRTNTLYWTVIFLTFFIVGLTAFGDPDNELHTMALYEAMSLYVWVTLGVIANTAVDAAVTAYFQRKAEVTPHET